MDRPSITSHESLEIGEGDISALRELWEAYRAHGFQDEV